MEVNSDIKNPVHIAILAGPGTGHLNPLLEFSKRLIQVSPNSFSITFITIPNSSSDEDINKLTQAQTSFLSTLPDPSHFEFHSLPPPIFPKEEFTTFPEQLLAKVFLTINRSLPSLRHLLNNLSTSNKGPVTSFFFDMFATDAIEVALELGMEPYLFFPSGAMGLRLFMQLGEMDRTVSGNFADMTEPVKLPGCVPLLGKDFPDPILYRNAVTYQWNMDHAKRYSLVKGIVVNTFEAFEVEITRALKEEVKGKLSVYPIGPLTTPMTTAAKGCEVGEEREECLKWLDQQPADSVLYVNFGSGGTLSTKQAREIASGLEMSGQRFLWVVRVPNDEVAYGTYLGFDAKNPLHYLPQGFLERTKDRGFVVPNWAPQVPILSHESTGGFLTHCGWNSTLESAAVSGVPYIAWPLFAEQRLNAVFLEEDLKVAMRVRPDDGGLLVTSDQIVRLVKRLMTSEEGKEMGKKMKVMKDEAVKAVVQGGSSNIALVELVTELLNNN